MEAVRYMVKEKWDARAMFLADHLSPEEFPFSPGALVLASPRQQDHILSILFCLFESSNDCTEKKISFFFGLLILARMKRTRASGECKKCVVQISKFEFRNRYTGMFADCCPSPSLSHHEK